VVRRRQAVLIAGPTASGKSALAIEVANRLNGVVVNADSAQVYRDLSIITARPSETEEALAPHRLYGYRPAHAPFSVADWLADIAALLDELAAENRIPVVVGGTGLYFRALTEGLVTVPEIPDDIRAHWRRRADTDGSIALHEDLVRLDPRIAERLLPSDSQRITRALEVIDATGRSLLDWQSDAPSPPLLHPDDCLRLVIEIDRALLHDRINRRFVAMVEEGALNEARAFAALAVPEDRPAARAIGVRPLIGAARGEIPLDEAIARGQAESRQYAKRQVTWQRHQMADWTRIPAGSRAANVLADFPEKS
jgi:tRNA dimethylallyltransferase